MYLKHNDINSYINTLPLNTRYLDLSYKFKTPFLPDLSKFEELEDLRCYKMGLTSLKYDLPKSLKKIDFSDNEFDEIPQQILQLPKLSEFYICWNNLKELQYNLIYTNLKVFDCSENKIEYITNSIYKWNTLEKFYCENNKISFIPKRLPESLKEFYVSHNPIKELPNNWPKNIKVIECINCPIVRFPFYIPYNIERFIYTLNDVLLDLYPQIKTYDNKHYYKDNDVYNFKNKIKYINRINQILCEKRNYCSDYLR